MRYVFFVYKYLIKGFSTMEKIKKKIPTGTKEWATSNINLISGCSHNCRYCYAKKMALRFGRKTKSNWKIMELHRNKLNQRYKKRRGRIMFPSSHDIVPEFKNECFLVLEKLLNAGNSVLITSKPHFKIIKELCNRFVYFRDQIQFRFTITTINNNKIEFWEEGAPPCEERFQSLKYAYQMKYKTSVSIEPFLDLNPTPLVLKLYPFISETIWLGKMNYIDRKNLTSEEKDNYNNIRKNYTEANLQNIINTLIKYKKIRYKDSIKKMDLKIPFFQSPDVKTCN